MDADSLVAAAMEPWEITSPDEEEHLVDTRSKLIAAAAREKVYGEKSGDINGIWLEKMQKFAKMGKFAGNICPHGLISCSTSMPLDALIEDKGTQYFGIDVYLGDCRLWRLHRRYDEFRKLNLQITAPASVSFSSKHMKNFSSSLSDLKAQFPPKHMTKCKGETLRARHIGLETWLKAVVCTYQSSASFAVLLGKDLHNFLEWDKHASITEIMQSASAPPLQLKSCFHSSSPFDWDETQSGAETTEEAARCDAQTQEAEATSNAESEREVQCQAVHDVARVEAAIEEQYRAEEEEAARQLESWCWHAGQRRLEQEEWARCKALAEKSWLQQAVDMAGQAHQNDIKHRALEQYRKSAALFAMALKQEKSEKVQAQLQLKMEEMIRRAEELPLSTEVAGPVCAASRCVEAPPKFDIENDAANPVPMSVSSIFTAPKCEGVLPVPIAEV